MENQENTRRDPTGRRSDVLRTLRAAAAPMSIVELADRLGVHPNTVRFHLETLVQNDQVERVDTDRRVPGRPAQLFRAVRGMDPTGPRHYRLLAEVLAQELADRPNPCRRAAEAGRAWGRRQGAARSEAGAGTGAAEPEPGEPVLRLVALLDELGFAPERREENGRTRIGLRHCPFLELAENTAQVVCPLHLGLMQGAMESWGAPMTVDRLEPFAEPDLCLAHLTAVEAS